MIAQNYAAVPAEQFIEDVRHLITDPRYMKIAGKPVLAIYRITQIPDFTSVLAHWRQRAADFGLPGLTLLAVDVGADFQGISGDVREAGLDGLLEFPPHNRPFVHPEHGIHEVDERFTGVFLSYAALMNGAEQADPGKLEKYRYPGVMVNFDNAARRRHQSHIVYGSNPFSFRRWLRTAVLSVQDRPHDERIVFMNAWNEWAEGAVLEPSQRFGHCYLQAVRSVLLLP